MNIKSVLIFSVISCIWATGANAAGWQYPGQYTGDGWYQDDGSRFVLSFRGGASVARGGINNEIGTMTSEYYVNPADGMVISSAYYDTCVAGGGCADFVYAGIGDISGVPADKDFSGFSFAAGASVGWTVSNSPQWRIELGWDHVTETEYNVSPLFQGAVNVSGGTAGDISVNVQSGGAHSSITTDVISAMAFYDFFDGIRKPLREFIPYVGFGLGYADSKTVLQLSDLYGDLSISVDLQNYGELDEYGVLQFFKSEKSNPNVAGLLAFGFSYGLTERMFLDLGARVTYLPKVKWVLSNADGSKTRDWFSASNLIYANIMLGIRFEF